MSTESVALVLNGNARSVTPQVVEELKRRTPSGDVFVSKDLAQASEIADAIVQKGYKTVLSGGGDGTFTITLTEVNKAAQKHGRPLPQFGVLKLGTGNAIAKVVRPASLSGSRNWTPTGVKAVRMVETEGYLTPFAGVGADAEILADYAKTRRLFQRTPLAPWAVGLGGYCLAALTRSLPKYVFRRMPEVRVVNLGGTTQRLDTHGRPSGPPVSCGETLYQGSARIAGLSTIPYYGFNFRMFPFAEARPDRMQLRISTLGSLEFATHVRSIWKGEYSSTKTLFDFHVEHVRVEISPPTDFQIGGDTHGKRLTFEARLSAEAVHLASY